MGRLRRLFLGGLWSPEVDDAVEWEIRHHLEERIDELVAGGMSRSEAEREARRSFGDLERVRREMRAVSRGRRRRERFGRLLESLGEDVRDAWRRVRSRPGFAAVVVLVLGLGIGANATLFSALEAALLKSAPYPDADRLVIADLLTTSSEAGSPADTLQWSYPKYEAASEALRSVERLAAYRPQTGTLTGVSAAERIGFEYVSPSYFELLGVRPVVGRSFTGAEEDPGAAAVALLGHGLWQRRYGGDPGVVGRTVTFEGESLEVVGVLPAGFRGLSGAAELWVPVAGAATIQGPRRLELAWAHWLRAIGRLRAGVTIEAAREEAEAVGVVLNERFPNPNEPGDRHGMTLTPLVDARVNPVARLAIAAVGVAAGLLLIIACANVGGLFLARATARRGELAVRAALGAGRARLVRGFAVESVMLAAAGGAVAVALAVWGQGPVRWAVRNALGTSGGRGLEFLDPDTLAVDGTVLALAIGLALATGLAFAILPARIASRLDLTGRLRAARPGAVGRTRDRAELVRGGLVAGQLALTLVLLAGTGLVGASFARLAAVDVGYGNADVLMLGFDRGPGPAPDDVRAFERDMLERISGLPGVESVAVVPCAPLGGRCEIVGVDQVDERRVEPDPSRAALAYPVSDGYFETLEIPVLEGRTFSEGDAPGGRPVVVVNEAAAREYFPDGSPIGHRLGLTHSLTEDGPAEIVGVVKDVRYGELEEPAMPAVYLSRRQAPVGYGTLVVATAGGEPLEVVGAVRGVVAELDPDLPLFDVTTLAAREAVATARTRVVLGLLGAFGLTGLLLAAVGLYGAISYSVVRRTREIGLRIALGAGTRRVVRTVLASPALLVAAGTAGGVLGAVILTRFVEGLLFGVEPSDPRVLIAAAVVLLGVAAVAAWAPARRAARLDPAEVLKGE
ncbi:MAG: ADOP family duplicated permease [Gemmatimonadota bacterium]